MSIKTRSLNTTVQCPDVTNPNTGAVIQKGSRYEWTGRQYTVSVGHRKGRNGQYLGGGPFFTYRTSVSIGGRNATMSNAAGTRYYSGPVMCSLVPTTMASVPTPTTDHSFLDPYGAEAIARVNPMNPNADLGVAMGELVTERRFPLPAIASWKHRTDIAKAAGSEYLSAVFGWLPLVSEMKNVSQSVVDGNEIIRNYGSNSGTSVHRRFDFPPTVVSSEGVIGSVPPTFGGGLSPELAKSSEVHRSRSTTTKRWFSGAFTYHAPTDRESYQKCLGIGSEAEKLLGLSLTPELVWELTPWSWAVDWFSNAGDVISNASAMKLAGLVMRYGYIMEESKTVDVYTQTARLFRKGKEFTVPLRATVTSVTKRRGEANPFGFGVKWDGLSPTQLAITAALGITRLR